MMNYKEKFCPYIKNFNKVEFTESAIKKVTVFVNEIIKIKIDEPHHIIDNGSEFKRFFTGTLGEIAIEHFLKCNFFDWTIGNSNEYNQADLKKIGLNIGVKTVEYGKFPVVHKDVKRPEIINVKIDNEILICGFASIDLLNKYQDDALILSPSLRARNVKSGFYGFEHLIQFKSIEDLKKLSAR
ncbi:hypothetical protein [Clostridium estertheticum]|uniref:hypothetical protein n=1 Tax=Clostridium estertheticum TaxID=238834 RepID=UPI001CF34429|nr:hypothetical protein [Clostridium estertheticum]MCB2356901.1 hypothetical protein [Clostridium estertheticum]WAG44021.1 hypothetical protein LL065_25965 [Clostridium estertheticum]